METLRNIDVPLVSSLLTLKRFPSFSYYFIVEFGEVFPAAFTSRDQSTDNVCRWMQIAGFEQTSTKFIEIIVPQEQFLYRKKTVVETTTEAINDTSDVLCFDLYLENLRRHRDAQTLCSNGHLIVYLLVLKI